ncbi:MAG TPA: DUF4349 domain-containing protein [Gaiellaceae bacterium]
MSRPENEKPNEQTEKTTHELRKHRPRPSDELVSRIERLAERGAARRSHPARIQVSRRKLVFALAATLSVAVAGGIVAGELRQPSNKAVVIQGDVRSRLNTGQPLTVKAINPASKSSSNDATFSAEKQASSAPTAAGVGSLASITTGNRLADLRATLLLKVENRDQLSKQTARAMKIARSFSGYVVAAQVNAPDHGVATSYLQLKIPAARSQEALIAISSLGKILSQEISLEDLKVAATSQSKQILGLRHEITSLQKQLEDPSLTTQARAQLQAKLEAAKAKLGALRVAHQQTISRGRLATITVNFTTGDLKTAPAQPSRIHKALNRAWDGLSSEISWAAIGLIVASPFLLLAALLAVLVRNRRRREERRLLEK